MHRRAAASTTTSKVAESRERRARRGTKLSNGGGIRNANGLLPHHLNHPAEKGEGLGKFLMMVIFGTLFLCLTLFWGGAIYHFTTNSSSDGDGSGDGMKWKFGGSLPENPLRRIRNDKSKYQSNHESVSESIDLGPYTSAALEKNPHLGWQPPVVSSSISWRTCFKAAATSDGKDQPAGCNENPAELGSAPLVEKDWIPDVTMVRNMMIYGKDRDGNHFPPPLSKELCEDIGVFGEKKGDTNKECLRETMIRPTGPLNSTTVTIDPSNHFGQDSDTENGSLTVPAPKVMCLVYTMANAHANRIRAMRDTWAGGCDGFLAFSTESDPRLPAISIEHEGPEEYNNVSFQVCHCVFTRYLH